MIYNFLLSLIFFLSCAHDHSPGEMNAKFMDPHLDASKFNDRFENDTRDVYIHRKEIVAALDLKKGEVVADVGAGTGTFLRDLHQAVGPEGKVYAVEISDGFLNFLKKRVQAEELTSIEVIKGDDRKTNLAENSVDLILLVDVYHHFEDPQAMLRDFRKILKNNGRLAIVDFDKIPGKSREWIISHMRLDKEGYIKEISKEGFELVNEVKSSLKENFMLIFK